MLLIAVTGGIEIFSEDVLASLGSLKNTCCLFHADFKNVSNKKSLIFLKSFLNRVSPLA